MQEVSLSTIDRRRAYLAGPALTLLRRLAAEGAIHPDVFTSRDGCRACLLGHVARMPPLRAQGWDFVNGIPRWERRMGVDAARIYFALDWQQALDLFGNSTESRAVSLSQRFAMVETLLRCSMSKRLRVAV